MALSRLQIEHPEHLWEEELLRDKPSGISWWRKLSKSRKFYKKQLNRYIRRQNKNIDENNENVIVRKKPYKGTEY